MNPLLITAIRAVRQAAEQMRFTTSRPSTGQEKKQKTSRDETMVPTTQRKQRLQSPPK